MRRVTYLVVGLIVGGLALAARAEIPDPSLDAFYGGTLEVRNVEGWRIKRYLNPDNTFTQTGSDGRVRGTWTVAEGRLCTTQEAPRVATNRPKTYCNSGPGYRAGDRWRDIDPVTGDVFDFRLHPGR